MKMLVSTLNTVKQWIADHPDCFEEDIARALIALGASTVLAALEALEHLDLVLVRHEYKMSNGVYKTHKCYLARH